MYEGGHIHSYLYIFGPFSHDLQRGFERVPVSVSVLNIIWAFHSTRHVRASPLSDPTPKEREQKYWTVETHRNQGDDIKRTTD
jgi:hypothetical protein